MNRTRWVSTLIVSIHTSIAWAGDTVTLGKVASVSRRVSLEQIEHTQWDFLLNKYCDSSGFVDYLVWQQSQPDLQMLDQYLAHLSTADLSKSSTHAGQLAFWINAYNAVTIRGILREYPTSSIRNHTARFFGYNIWDDLLLPVGDHTYSLNQMEHDVLRKMGEPRIHFALVCASVGCPPLLNSAYTTAEIDSQLMFNSKRFFANHKKFRYDTSNNSIQISPIFKWFAEDFGQSQIERLKTIAPYLPDQQAKDLAISNRARISYLDYDWDLNDQASKVAPTP